MKKYLFTMVLGLFLIGCASVSPEQGVERIVEVDTSKSETFDKSLDWAARFYVDSKSVIEVKDAERGRIIGRGVLIISSSMGMREDLYAYTLQIDVKEDKARIKMNNIRPYAGKGGVSDPSYFEEEILEKMNSVAESFATALTADDDSW
ncbi:DUF4468 domain-containing protein [Vibrio parahaemolyticus]|uniref:DUF4468 domain-containing protein n=1 Tax=Vibrio parahaemolyticus TaxID=670 RepID=UPI0015F395E6|nr:DUF4468 domain-containing protein [Vibrio parahaemolyticus]